MNCTARESVTTFAKGRITVSAYADATTSYGYDDDLLLTQANGFAISRNTRHGLPEAITATGYQQGNPPISNGTQK